MLVLLIESDKIVSFTSLSDYHILSPSEQQCNALLAKYFYLKCFLTSVCSQTKIACNDNTSKDVTSLAVQLCCKVTNSQ